MHKKILFISIAWLCAITGMAQNLEIKQDFKISENSSAAIMYHNQFGKYEKPAMDDTFPYAVVRVLLEGNAYEVKEAKKMLGIYTGVLSQGVKASYLDFENEILFLVPSSSGHVELSCGEGCARQTILELPKLQSNAVYVGKVHYTPMQEPVQSTTTQAPKRQFFKFRVSPADAIVEIDVNGQKDMWHVSDGVASKPLNYGTYHYTISANRYHTENGTFSVSDTQTEKTVALQPKFGWLSITSSNAQDAYVYVTNTQTGTRQSLGTLPINRKDLDSGTYTLLIQKDKYKDYTTNFTIEEGKTTTLNPTLEANFVRLTLTTALPSDIYIDNQKLGTNRWTGTLELGEYVVETRQASHHSAYTNVRITPQSAGQTITLNNPLPIYGSMMLTSSPADAVVYVDGVKKGLTPLIVNELLIGAHRVRIEKEGYDTQEKTVTITEGQESVVEYTLTNEAAKASPASASIGGHEYVDLGLSVKWATCNIGATKPEEYGDYFAWGETEPKSTYSWSTYKWCRGSRESQTKYCTNSYYGTVDNKTVLEAADDAARANWGGNWRMPTLVEQDELRKKCTWTWTTQNGVNGYKVTSKSNGNSIFLPAAGHRYYSSRYLAGTSGGYLSSLLNRGSSDYAWYVDFNSDDARSTYGNRYYGFSVRPVTPMQDSVQSTTTQVQNDATNYSSTNHSTTSETMIHGRVVDSKGEPLIGASIIEKGTANGTITDFDGEFTLTVKGNAILEVNYVGFKSQILNAQKVMDITLLKKGERLKNK